MDINDHDLQIELFETFLLVLDKKFNTKSTVRNLNDFGGANWRVEVAFDSITKHLPGRLGSEEQPLYLNFGENFAVELIKLGGLFQNLLENFQYFEREFVPREFRITQ